MKLGRVVIDLGYVVDMENQEQVAEAKRCFYDDLSNAQRYNELASWMEVQPDENATEDMIPEHITVCKKCGSSLDEGYCTDETCPYYDYLQDEEYTEA